ncbi:MAG TPA: VOC family protein [Kineosporiaceae bacterium]
MSTRTTPWEPGTPCWYDLAALDLAASTRFYRATFGWDLRDTGADYGHYTFCLIDDKAVAGIGTAPEGSLAAAPLTWTVYLAVDDADKTAEAIAGHGGRVLMPPLSIGDQGRMALAADPTGATVGIWQADQMFGAVLVNEPGSVVWNDHHSVDPAGARDFYAAVFGYRYTTVPGERDYNSVDGAGPGNTVAGIGGPDGDLPDLPAHWMTYFAVASTDDTVERATAAGGTLVSGPADTPFGQIAVLRDPQGTYFKIGSSTTV